MQICIYMAKSPGVAALLQQQSFCFSKVDTMGMANETEVVLLVPPVPS
jgi:hypothetical protein